LVWLRHCLRRGVFSSCNHQNVPRQNLGQSCRMVKPSQRVFLYLSITNLNNKLAKSAIFPTEYWGLLLWMIRHGCHVIITAAGSNIENDSEGAMINTTTTLQLVERSSGWRSGGRLNSKILSPHRYGGSFASNKYFSVHTNFHFFHLLQRFFTNMFYFLNKLFQLTILWNRKTIKKYQENISIKSFTFAASFRGISRLGAAFMFLPWFKLASIYLLVTSLNTAERFESTSKFLIWNRFHVAPRIYSYTTLSKWKILHDEVFSLLSSNPQTKFSLLKFANKLCCKFITCMFAFYRIFLVHTIGKEVDQ